MTQTIVADHGIPKEWWKSAVVYQIYPPSFYDSNGDGVGDLPGVISKLDYLKALGVDVVWLSPIFKSPQVDMGYDISDYKDIHAPYGTVQDVEKLAKELHNRDMKLMLDLVVNHTSDEHDWFIQSRSSKSSPKRDWYHWQPAKYDAEGKRRPPNNWKTALGGGSVWEWDEESEEYYLHLYDVKQPDLKFETPAVREAVYDLMRFWIDRGCDGFRMDVIGRISKDLSFPDAPVDDPESEWQEAPRTEGPRLHEFIQEMNREVLGKYHMMTVGELNHVDVDQMLKYSHPDRKEIQMGFTFEHVNIGRSGIDRAMKEPHKLSEFKEVLARWQTIRDKGAWHALYLENHDQPRSISVFANDAPEWRERSGRLLAMMHTTMSGTVYIHQGQEIGMINLPKDWPLEEWKDVKTQNVAKKIIARGKNVDELFKKLYHKARDNARTPMQWDDSPQAGFTSSTRPWMRIPDDYKTWNVQHEAGQHGSVLSFWKEMLALRKEREDELIYGSFEHLSPEDESVFVYIRAETVLVVMNFSTDVVEYQVPERFTGAKVLKQTAQGEVEYRKGEVVLQPYSGVILAL